MSRTEASHAQHEVWASKDQAYEEVKHLDLAAAIRKRLEDSARTVEALRVSKIGPVASREKEVHRGSS